MDEVLYSARVNKFGTIELAKFSGHKRPDEIYSIRSNGNCDCMGWGRNQHCKHNDIIALWQTLGPFEGGFLNFETKTLYTPEDDEGEGIPLTGAFDIMSAYQTG